MKLQHRLPAFSTVALACILCATGSVSAAPSSTPAPKPASAWSVHVVQCLAGHFAANPAAAVRAGKHEFDGQIGDFSEAALQKQIERLHAEREKAAAFKDDQLTDRERFERDY